jgi:SpoVK/Ycf46/Vps4 family AAA+-type ATPase
MSAYRTARPTPDVACSFCGKSSQEVRKLLAAERASICDDCVELCRDIVAEQAQKARPERTTREAIEALFDERVVGHAEAKRALTAALLERKARAGRPFRAPRVLLVGPLGVGKSALGHALVAAVPNDGHATSVGRMSEHGYVGDDVEHALAGLLAVCGRDAARAGDGVLFLDDVDALSTAPSRRHARDISGERVQHELVRLLDGQVVEVAGAQLGEVTRIDTRSLTVVAAVRAPAHVATGTAGLRAALRELGLIEPLVARFDRLVWVAPPSPAETVALVARQLAEANRVLASSGCRLELAPGVAEAIAAQAHQGHGWAVRALFRIFLEAALLERPRVAYVDQGALQRFWGGA